ncbi:sodium-dependent glucose transporter 1-like [Haliotis rubra]|uniref:sodium-dependent glucose transporter 1-like n=1 Tax=Haliotis rubra TaxID=36100 RepID=UPI001EE568AC|nr:sodium-dependent glucose transporter 1-like [Haliotis rubra]
MVKIQCWKILQTVWIFWSLVMVGVSDSLLGPSLLELQSLLQVDLQQLNFVVLSTGLGDFVGAILAGLLSKTCGCDLRLSVSVLLGSLSVALSAVIPNYYYVLTFFTLQGFLRGFVYCYAIEKCNALWRENKGVPFQCILLGTTTGGIISPLFIKLFLCTPYDPETAYFTATNVSYENVNITDLKHPVLYRPQTQSSELSTFANASDNATLSTSLRCLPQDVYITYAYYILAILVLPPAFAFFIYWRQNKGKSSDDAVRVTREDLTNHEPKQALVILFSVLFVILYFPLLGSSVMYSTYLTEFGVKGPLHLEKPKMVMMTSLYWGSSLLGRIIAIFLTPFIGVEKLIYCCMIPLLIGETVLVFTVQYSEVILWICTCTIGIFISPNVGAGYAWCAKYVKFGPRIISASGASLGLGAMVLPFVGGVMFDVFGPMSYLYLCYSLYIFVALLFCTMLILTKKMKSPSVEIDVDVDMCEERLSPEK